MDKNRQILTMLFELSKATRCCNQMAAFGEGITFHQFYILDLVDREGSMELSQLHRALFVEKSTTTRLIEPLVRKELLVKLKSPNNYRAIELRITEEGRKACARVWEKAGIFITALDAEIPEKKRDEVYEAVSILLRVLNGFCFNGMCEV